RRSRFDLIPEMKTRLLERFNGGCQICHAKDDPVPSPGFLASAARQRARTRCAGTAQQNLERAERHARKRGELLVDERETQMPGIERDGSSDVFHLIANTMKFHNSLLRFHFLDPHCCGGFDLVRTTRGYLVSCPQVAKHLDEWSRRQPGLDVNPFGLPISDPY